MWRKARSRRGLALTKQNLDFVLLGSVQLAETNRISLRQKRRGSSAEGGVKDRGVTSTPVSQGSRSGLEQRNELQKVGESTPVCGDWLNVVAGDLTPGQVCRWIWAGSCEC